MDAWTEWLGDLNQVSALNEQAVGILCIAVSGLCGAIVGVERERRSKPAGVRTLILICVGSTVFTMASILIADGAPASPGILRADRARIAAQVVTGIGFLGAGAIIHARRSVVGLTTGASIWVVSAIGVVVGAGYAIAGIVLACLIFAILTLLKAIDRMTGGRCRHAAVRLRYETRRGKTKHFLLGVLDDHHVDPSCYRFGAAADAAEPDGEHAWLEIHYCRVHPNHRSFLPELASIDAVLAIDEIGAGEGAPAPAPVARAD